MKQRTSRGMTRSLKRCRQKNESVRENGSREFSAGGAGGAGGKRVRPRSATLHSEVYLNFPEKPAKIGV